MEVIVIILFISICISLYVIIPLFKTYYIRKNAENEVIPVDSDDFNEYHNLIKQRDLIISEIRDIDFDYGLGKLNIKDYNEIKDKYRFRAAEIYKKIDEIEDIKLDTDKLNSIENEILQVKKINREQAEEYHRLQPLRGIAEKYTDVLHHHATHIRRHEPQGLLYPSQQDRPSPRAT